jgi:predicted ribosomally synthesized peptide with SipW-like signal peptide
VADHRSAPRRGRRLGGLVLMALTACLTLLGATGTAAYWSVDDTVSPATLRAGTLDVVLNGDADDDVALATLDVPDLLPGDSRAATLTVVNASDRARLRYTVTGQGSGLLLPNLRVELYTGTATNTGSTTTGYASGCSGAVLTGPVTLTTASTSLLGVAASDARPALAPTNGETLCVRVSLPVDAPQVAQGRSGAVSFLVTGRSVVG